jgi:phosphoribosylformimino-5-aminoimidazole carboxamide ribotide isomerase
MFRPCIDLHDGNVKQIVGGSLSDNASHLRTNFISDRPAWWYAELYKKDQLTGGHVIMLGPGNEKPALEALKAYPGGLQIGGGINAENAAAFLEAGASHVIVTSWIFREGRIEWDRLRQLVQRVGKKRLVLDLSCRVKEGDYYVVTDRWQKFTDQKVTPATLALLAEFCDEYLIHAVDVEGLCRGIDLNLVRLLSEHCPLPSTYAGGASSFQDLVTVTELGRNRVHLTIGSALDIFGGDKVKYEDCVAYNRSLKP